jgi:hypothetical protein
MRRSGLACALFAGLWACGQWRTTVDFGPGSPDGGSPDAAADVTVPDAGQADAGADAGDAGISDAGITPSDGGITGQDGGPDAGAADAGAADAGAADAGAPDAGTSHVPGGWGAGPWPTVPLAVYDSAQGLLEAPLSASTDEQQNIWVVTTAALYLLRPGEQRFHRFTAADGLHVGPGYTEPPDFTLVIGGGAGLGKGECFVGYYFHDTHDPPTSKTPVAHTANDPVAHMGKMDQVLPRADGTLEVRRYDFHNSNNGFYYETRTIMSGIYDHFAHPGELYVGTNHGVIRVLPQKWRLPQTTQEASFPLGVERTWYADHVHPWVCEGGPCSDLSLPPTFGDWFGLTLTDGGLLWMAGLTSAGAIHWKEALADWVQSWKPVNPFDPAFGDPYPGNPPVFEPPREGDPVNLRAVAVTPDGTVWFASGAVEDWRGATYGLAAWDGKRFTYVDPGAIGSPDGDILELVALPDGRLVLGLPNTGLLVWRPGDPKGHRLTSKDGLPGDRIGRLYLDRMVDPPALYVPTDNGLAVLRKVP